MDDSDDGGIGVCVSGMEQEFDSMQKERVSLAKANESLPQAITRTETEAAPELSFLQAIKLGELREDNTLVQQYTKSLQILSSSISVRQSALGVRDDNFARLLDVMQKCKGLEPRLVERIGKLARDYENRLPGRGELKIPTMMAQRIIQAKQQLDDEQAIKQQLADWETHYRRAGIILPWDQ